MKTTANFFTIGILLFGLFLSSCSKDGTEGPMGPQRQQGEQGVQGETGQQGEQGPKGEDGTGGQDGNANVRVYVYDLSEVTGSSHLQPIPELTQEVMDNSAILGYITTIFDESSMLPAIGLDSGFFDNDDNQIYFGVSTYFRPDYYSIRFFNSTSYYGEYGASISLSKGFIKELKIVIIEASNITSGKSGGDILTNLYSAGVDISQYEAVMDYFELEY